MSLPSKLLSRYIYIYLAMLFLLGGAHVRASDQQGGTTKDDAQVANRVPAQDTAKQLADRNEHPFNRQWLLAHAKKLSQVPFEPIEIDETSPLADLNYDEYRAIEFQNAASIWKNEDRNFRLGLLHPGFLYDKPVVINLVTQGVSRQILYTTDIFNYRNDSAKVEKVSAPGYSGFRVNNPINTEGKWDEFLVFQGGSYFRALGELNWYGLSARGLAINTAKPEGEEFPIFSEFWIERPKKQEATLKIHALLESESVTGAYTFHATPGTHTQIDVELTLFPRRELKAFGIAPLTSMFLLDAKNRTHIDDFRPAVHDSDGLLIQQSNGERVWRPLANPKTLQVSSFMSDSLAGFGLMQRKRQFEDFQDVEARYEKRPSVWIKPQDDWGQGHIELIEIPTDREFNDNIVAYWQPKQPLLKGESHTYKYTMRWSADPVDLRPSHNKVTHRQAHVVATRSGLAVGEKKVREFAIDYSAQSIPDDLKVHVETSAGSIVDKRGMVILHNGLYRVTFKFDPADIPLAEFRLWLTSNDKPWGETWLYRWTR